MVIFDTDLRGLTSQSAGIRPIQSTPESFIFWLLELWILIFLVMVIISHMKFLMSNPPVTFRSDEEDIGGSANIHLPVLESEHPLDDIH